MRDYDIRLRGAYSISLVGEALLRRLPSAPQRLLLVTWNKAGLRQSYYEEGRLRFSRLSPLAHTDTAAVAAAAAIEVDKTQQYLSGLRLFPREAAPLDACLLVDGHDRAVFEAACASNARVNFSYADANRLAQSMRLRAAAPEVRGERLFLHALATLPPKDQSAPPVLRRHYQVALLRRIMVQGTGAALGLCVAWSGVNALEAFGLRTEADLARRQTEDHRRNYERLTQMFPGLPTTPDNLRAVVQGFNRLTATVSSPERALIDLSQVLQETPGIQLTNLRWVSLSPESDAQMPRTLAQPVFAEEQLELTALVPLARPADYRGANEAANRLIEALKQRMGVEVLFARLPFDLSSSGNVSVGRSGLAADGEAELVVRFKRKARA